MDSRPVPHSEEAEKAVLSGLLLASGDFLDELMTLSPEVFWTRSNLIIFNAILELYSKNQKIDLITVTNLLKSQDKLEEIGGAAVISKLAMSSPLAAHALEYAEILKEKWRLRGAIDIAQKIESRAYSSEESKAIIAEAESFLYLLNSHSVQDGVGAAVKNLDRLVSDILSGNKQSGIPTGIKAWDETTGGLLEGRYYVLAARPKLGKTALATQIAVNVAMRSNGVLNVSIELSSERYLGRAASYLSGVPYVSILYRNATKEQLQKYQTAYHLLHQKPFYIENPVQPTGPEIRSMIRRYKKKFDIKLVVIDYLQKCKMGKDPRQSIAEASESIRCACRETGVPAIVLCQLNREADKERPRMSHLKESGAIEQDADVVAIIFRDGKEEPVPGMPISTVLAFDANRDGPECDHELLYEGKTYKFKDLEEVNHIKRQNVLRFNDL